MAIYYKFRAIAYAVVVFVVLFYALTLGANYLAGKLSNFVIWQPWLIFSAYILYLLSGLIAGIISKEQRIVVGVVAGLVSALMAILVFGVGRELMGVLFTLFWGLVLGGLGARLSVWFRKRAVNAL